MSAPSLVVSIHDVSPFTRDAVTSILDALAASGIGRVSLLVIPDHHERGKIGDNPAFCSWLRDLVAAGHEPVLHGYTHRRERHAQEPVRTRLVTRLYTADEGEFFDIPFAKARDLLTRGREELAQAAGVAPQGFIAPAWLLSKEAEAAARDLAFTYTTRLKTISDLTSGRLHKSQSLCWSVRAPWRRFTSLAWNAALYRALQQNPLLRLSIHPPDFSHPETRRQIQRLASAAAQDRKPVTYREFAARFFPA